MSERRVFAWAKAHPSKMASIAGWYQQLAGVVGAYITIPYVLTILPPAQSGIWFTFQGFLAAASLTDFGFSLVVTRQVAYTLGRQVNDDTAHEADFMCTRPGWAGVAEIYRAARLLYACAGVAGLLILVAARELVMPFTRLNGLAGGNLGLCWYALGLATLVTIQARLSGSVLEGSGGMHITKAFNGTVQLLGALTTVAALHIKGTMLAASLTVLAVSLFSYLCLRALLLLQGSGLFRAQRCGPTQELSRRLWKIALPMGVVTSSGYCVSSIQVPLLGAILGPSAVAPYYLAQRIGQTVTTAIAQLLQPQLPAFTLEYSTRAFRAARRRLIRVLAVVSICSVIGCAAYSAASPLIVALWLGSGHFVPGNVLALMALEYVLLCCSATGAQFVIASGRNPFMWTTLLNGALNIALAAYLATHFGVIALPIAGLAAGMCSNYFYAPYRTLRLLRALGRRPQASIRQPACQEAL